MYFRKSLLLPFFCIFLIQNFQSHAQTNPTAQALPYSENFSSLTHTSTAYLSGTQGWVLGSSITGSFRTNAATGDRVLIASSSASNSSGGVHNYNGKIGLLPSSSVDPSLVWVVNTSSVTNITVSYDIMTIRNPYDGAANTRIDEIILQYRVGTSGSFTNLTGTEYQNNTTLQTGSGVTTPQNLQTMSVLLPVDCENQPVVQLRLAMRDVSGGGSRASMAIDNISVCTLQTFYADVDGDTYGDAASTTMACSAPSGYVADDDDCDDTNALINPAATEVCNGTDDNCDGNIDEGVETTFYADTDGDTYGDAASTTMACSAPSGYVADDDDCDDTNALINPAATEICNGADDNCDGNIDEGVETTFYADTDGDTYGDAASTTMACSAPSGYVANDDDCDDTNALINPAATEICNGADDNCDGNIDEGVATASITPTSATICKGDAAMLSANTGTGYTYQWFKNGNVIAGATSDTYNVTKPAYYQVEVTIPGGCSSLSSAVFVAVTPKPNANIFAPDGLDLCFDSSLKLKASNQPGYSWQWYKDGSPISGETGAFYFASEVGDYYCAITNSNGCSRNTPTVTVINSCIGEKLFANTIALYPNPASEYFIIELELEEIISGTATISMYDAAGNLAQQTQAEITDRLLLQEVHIQENVPAGIYAIHIQSGVYTWTKQIAVMK